MTSSRRPGLRRGRQGPPSEAANPAAFLRGLDEAATHFRAGRLEAAAQVYRRLERQAPQDVRPAYSLAVIDLNQGRLVRARERLEALAARAPDLAPAQHNLAAVRQALGDWAGAVEAYARAVELHPAAADSRVGLAGALAALGRAGEAIAQNRILAGDPDRRWPALTRIALVDPAAIDDADLAAMRVGADDGANEATTRAGLWFGLGEALDRRGRDAEAFAAYDAGNRLQRAGLDPAAAARAHAAAADQVRAVATPTYLARLKGQGSSSAAPIFVIGFPRCGSTLIEQVLASHPQVQGLGETAVLPRLVEGGYPTSVAAARDVADRYLEAMGARGWDGQRRFVDKTLENHLHAGLIAALFPRATILHAVRDPVDTGFACWRQLFPRGEATLYDLADIGEEYVRYRSLTAHWAQVAPGRIVEVAYEALATQPEPTIRALAAAAGLDWDPAMLRAHEREGAVTTASASQVRRPIYATSVRRWTRHADRLAPLIAALGPYAPQT